jgi:hypothetical protein
MATMHEEPTPENLSLFWVLIALGVSGAFGIVAIWLAYFVHGVIRTRSGIKRMEFLLIREIVRHPRISHTALFRAALGDAAVKEPALAKLVKMGRIKCKRSGRERWYFPQ